MDKTIIRKPIIIHGITIGVIRVEVAIGSTHKMMVTTSYDCYECDNQYKNVAALKRHCKERHTTHGK